MYRDLRLMQISALIGLGYGIVLSIFGFYAAGFGHGTYTVIGLSSAPVALTKNIIISLFTPPILWSVAAFLSAGSRQMVWRILYLLVMCMHYVSLFWILQGPSNFADWDYIKRVEGLFRLSIVFYCAGQLALWSMAFFLIWKSIARR